jgi:predicted Zn-dependent protease
MCSPQSIAELKREKQYAQALQAVEKLLAAAPDNPAWRLERADLLARTERPEEALRELNALPESRLSAYHLALKAGLLEHAGYSDEARVLFEELAGQPQLAPAVLRRVVRYFERVEPIRAVHLARRAAGPEALLLEAEALCKNGEFELATELLRDGLSQFPGHPRLLAQLADLQLRGLPPEEVARELHTLLSLEDNRNNLGLRERLVQALRASGELLEARQQLLECLRQSPDNHYFRANLAYVQRDLGETGPALDLMEQLLAEQPGDRYVLHAYYKTCRDAGLGERAREFTRARTEARPELRRWWGTLKKVFKAAPES